MVLYANCYWIASSCVLRDMMLLHTVSSLWNNSAAFVNPTNASDMLLVSCGKSIDASELSRLFTSMTAEMKDLSNCVICMFSFVHRMYVIVFTGWGAGCSVHSNVSQLKW